MSYSYILLEKAQVDIEESVDWYIVRSVQAAEKFVAALDVALLLACSNPYQWRNKYKDFFEIPLKNYPFSLIYTIEQDTETIVVNTVFHHKRNPKSKYR